MDKADGFTVGAVTKTNKVAPSTPTKVGAPSTPSSAASTSSAIPFYPCPVRTLSQVEDDAASGSLRSPAMLAPLKPSPHMIKTAHSQGESLESVSPANSILKKPSRLMTFRLPDDEPDLSKSGQGISSAVRPHGMIPLPNPKLRPPAQYALPSLTFPCLPPSYSLAAAASSPKRRKLGGAAAPFCRAVMAGAIDEVAALPWHLRPHRLPNPSLGRAL